VSALGITLALVLVLAAVLAAGTCSFTAAVVEVAFGAAGMAMRGE
jgi:hypothetical protein